MKLRIFLFWIAISIILGSAGFCYLDHPYAFAAMALAVSLALSSWPNWSFKRLWCRLFHKHYRVYVVTPVGEPAKRSNEDIEIIVKRVKSVCFMCGEDK